jgi:hypothetical protein
MEVHVSPKRQPRQVCRFALDAPEDCSVAVCMLPGTELAFEQPVTYQTTSMFRANTSHTVAIFRQINKSVLHIHHDALEFSDGEIVLRTRRKRPSGDTVTEKGDEFPPPHGAYPKAKDHGLSIAGPGAGSGPGIKAKSLPYLLTDSGQFDILLFGPGWRGSDAIRSTTSARVRHAARRRGGGMAARGARAAAQTLEALDIF